MGARRGRKRAKDSAEYSHDQFPPDEDVLMAGELQRQVMRFVQQHLPLHNTEAVTVLSETPGRRGRLSCHTPS
eukprot:764549-Hanusia_phi.AAC.5